MSECSPVGPIGRSLPAGGPPRRLREPGRQDRRRGLGGTVMADQGYERRRSDEWSVAGQHHDVPVRVGEGRRQPGEPHREGVCRAQLRLLLHELYGKPLRRVLHQRLGDQVAVMPDHYHHLADVHLRQSVEHVEDHGPAAKMVERLGHGGAHPGALACRQDYGT
ncbi:MAG: hypothetical protein M1522_09625 [Actinobacteria bacterium]|nr:hypothetical protein [Actinomycetota bacterium]